MVKQLEKSINIPLTLEQYEWCNSQCGGVKDYIHRLIETDKKNFDGKMRERNRKQFYDSYFDFSIKGHQNLIDKNELESVVRFIAECIRSNIDINKPETKFIDADKVYLFMSETLTSAVDGDELVKTEQIDDVLRRMSTQLEYSGIIDKIVNEYYYNVYSEEVRTDLILFLKMHIKRKLMEMKSKR